MKQTRFLGFLPVFCLLALPALRAQESQNELRLGEATAEFGGVAEVELTLSSTDEVQGVVAVFEWDDANLTGQGLSPAEGPGEALENADQVVTNFGSDFMVLGVVMDTDGSGVDMIPPGDTLLATAELECGGSESTTELTFVDGAHAAIDVEGAPLLDNIVVVGGLSIGQTEGLTLTDGEVRCIAAPDKLIIESGGNEEGEEPTAGIRILMNNNQEVEGFVTAICHDPADLSLDAVSLGAAAAAADFDSREFAPDGSGATFGVVMDLEDPMAMPPNIPPAQGNHIATYTYTCLNPPDEGDPPVEVDLTFCDNVLGDPLKENVIVVGGLSIGAQQGLVLENGTFTCRPAEVIVPPDSERGFCDDGIDNDEDGLIDGEDPDCQVRDIEFADGQPVPAGVGTVTEVPLTYRAPTEESLGIGGSGGNVLVGDSPRVAIQGFSLGFSYECDEVRAEESFDTTDTILGPQGLDAEFIGVSADNMAEAEDGDPCSLTLGVLVDAMPPFDGRVIPGLEEPQVLGTLAFEIRQGVACGDTVEVRGEDGVNGRGKVPVLNVLSVENQPFPASVRTLELVATPGAVFFRGDCNFSGRSRMLDPVEIADAAAVISFLFQKSIFKFDPPCLDACDANDDGRVDLADAIGILNYLFLPGAKFPPDPGPGLDETTLNPTDPGVDPTPDPLDCEMGATCDFPGF